MHEEALFELYYHAGLFEKAEDFIDVDEVFVGTLRKYDDVVDVEQA